jgi:hypothetical protein
MKRVLLASTAALFLLTSQMAGAQTAAGPKSAAEVNKTPADVVMTEDYIATIGREAYLWGWPLINHRHRRAAFSKVPEPGRLGGVLPIAPTGYITMLTDYIRPDQRFVTCPNQDVVYGFGFAAVDKEPIIIQVPDFGKRFWVIALYDARTDGFGGLGQQYATKPGNYMVVGPNWRGKEPKGINKVFRAPTDLIGMAPRIFMDDSAQDRKAIQPLLNKMIIYPLGQYTGEQKTKDWSKVPSFPSPSSGDEETHWVDPATFFDELPDVLREVPPLPGEEALYAQMRSLLDAAAKSPAVKEQLNRIAIDAEKTLIGPLFEFRNQAVPVGGGWTTPPNGARFGYDYLTRTAVARSNMFVNQPEETRYFYLDVDSKAERLNGANHYTVTYAKGKLPPVNGFWSLTLYNKNHFFESNSLNRFSLGTKNKGLKYNSDGSLTLYIQNESPGAEKEANWIPAPRNEFSLYQRTYWPKAEVLNGSWTPPPAQRVN